MDWNKYYQKKTNQRLFPDEDVCRFLGQLILPRNREITSLDWGCGDGRNGQAIRKFYPYNHLVGMDCYPEGILSSLNQAFYTQLTTSSSEFPNNTYNFIVDCLTTQHIAWANHPEVYRKFFTWLKPGGALFIKHLDNACTDRYLSKPIDMHCTFENIPETNGHVVGCYPNNGIVTMPPSSALKDTVIGEGFLIENWYRVIRDDYLSVAEFPDCNMVPRRFSHTVLFAKKPMEE